MQLEIYSNFVKDWKEEEQALMEEGNQADKNKEIEKREKEEFKKLEKLFKKESQDIEEIFNDSSLNPAVKAKTLKDRIAKTILETLKI